MLVPNEGVVMRSFLVAVLALVVGCTKPNPEVCCVTEDQCSTLGVGELRPCGVGQACGADFACVAAECESSIDCTSPDSPVCSLGLCVSNCRVDEDCAEVSGRPICADEGVCVGCVDATDCTGEASICDSETRACRGCVKDSECESGVCLEADGICAEESQVVFLSSQGGDTGNCEREMPCRTLAFGLDKIGGTRRVLRLEGGGQFPLTQKVDLGKSVYIDGTGNAIGLNAVGPVFRIIAPQIDITLSHVTLGATSGSVIDQQSSNLRLLDVRAVGTVQVTNATLDVRDSELESGFACTSGTASVHTTNLGGRSDSTNCALVVERSLFGDSNAGCLGASGGLITIENNLIVQTISSTDAMAVQNAVAGSTVRFNTFVNTTSTPGDGQALFCDATVDATSNIIAYRSAHPMGFPSGQFCASTFTLFDTVAVAQHTAGEGNVVADEANFFLDRLSGDFHLGASSPAKQAADPTLTVQIDFDGASRPQPAGTTSDIGAFEAP